MYSAYFIDDESLVLNEFINKKIFAECGYTIAGCSTDPFLAIKEIKRISPDVVFTDLKMPQCSGVELMDILKQKGINCEFVIVSAYGEFEESRRFFKMGGFDYLTKPISDYELQDLLTKLSIKLAAKKDKSMPADTPSPEFNKLIAFLRENITEKHTLETLSQQFGLNQKYICNLFANYLGTTFTSYMTALRMDEAARLLKSTQYSVKEIAGFCGYNDYFYFCRVFKEYHSYTPTAFRGVGI